MKLKSKLASAAMTCMFALSVPQIVAIAANGQTTIIYMEPNKASYDIGEEVHVRFGISSTDGMYITSAEGAIGYDGSTMELIEGSEDKNFFTISAATPQKTLYKDFTFRMKQDGNAYIVAGAYSGSGMIQAIKANGAPIKLPRASVVKKIGTGIVNTGQLQSVTITDHDSDAEFSLDQEFDSNVTEYWMEVDSDTEQLDFDAIPISQEDVVEIADGYLEYGENEEKLIVRSPGGQEKEYLLHITRPAKPLEVSDIRLLMYDGEEIEYEFSPDTTEYNISVEQDDRSVFFAVESNDENAEQNTKLADLKVGFNVIPLTISNGSTEKKYQFNIFRAASPLQLSSLVVEGSDGITLSLGDTGFDPENRSYFTSVTPDVQEVRFIYTLANEKERVKEKDVYYALHAGQNDFNLTVTDGTEEKAYTIHVIRPEYDFVEETETAPVDTRNHTEIQTHKKINFLYFLIPILLIGAGIIVLFSLNAAKARKDYLSSDEAKADQNEAERKKRLKELAEMREKQRKEKEKF